ncbi:MAG: hypothetical protein WD336_12460 [Trueperaceae bacterium]
MITDGTEFEINTDASLVDPDWEAFVAEHEDRFGLAIHHLKSVVKGSRYDNRAVKLRIGPRGFYLQSRRFPAAFFGGTDLPDTEFVSEEEARALAWEASALYRSGEARSLTCIYDDDDPPSVFFGYRLGDVERYEMGALESGLPLHLRVMVDADAGVELVGAPTGTVVYQRTRDGRHLVLRRKGSHTPFHPVAPVRD